MYRHCSRVMHAICSILATENVPSNRPSARHTVRNIIVRIALVHKRTSIWQWSVDKHKVCSYTVQSGANSANNCEINEETALLAKCAIAGTTLSQIYIF